MKLKRLLAGIVAAAMTAGMMSCIVLADEAENALLKQRKQSPKRSSLPKLKRKNLLHSLKRPSLLRQRKKSLQKPKTRIRKSHLNQKVKKQQLKLTYLPNLMPRMLKMPTLLSLAN